ncbi:hypothetical protein [Paenibacillus taichungensis]|uniref:hypothetical protein n=1 Tax=Paenibacillus taichungensis TaxID=484184 RepID=UPI0038D15D17
MRTIVPTYKIKYTRDRIATIFIVTLNGIELNIPHNLFLGVFPRIKWTNRTASLEASAAVPEVLNVIADSLIR